MDAQIITRTEQSFKLEIEIPRGKNILESEELIQQALNLAGVIATEETMKYCDTDGSPIVVRSQKLVSSNTR